MRLCTESTNGYAAPVRLNGHRLGGVGFFSGLGVPVALTPSRTDAFKSSTTWTYAEPTPVDTGVVFGPSREDAFAVAEAGPGEGSMAAMLTKLFQGSTPLPRAPLSTVDPFAAKSILPTVALTVGGLALAAVVVYALRRKK